MSKPKKRFKKRYKIFLFLIILLLILGSSFYAYKVYKHNKQIEMIRLQEERERREREEAEAKRKAEEYNLCINKKYDESELTNELLLMMQDIDNLIINNNYKTSVKYEDITTGFSYEYKANQVYYGCSLIKIVDAIYLINQAIEGKINLDTETITYTANYKRSFSSGMAMHSYGDEVTLRELITHAVSVSDNSAHIMLIDYIGFDKLQAYGRSLGATNILTESDKFGNQSAIDTNIYLKEAYRIITENEEYGPFLKSIMDNDERNAFNTEDIRIYHKYGAYDKNFHDIGLNLDTLHPYAISIFTLHEEGIYKEVIQGIHSKIIELHDAFYDNRKNTCYMEIYEN